MPKASEPGIAEPRLKVSQVIMAPSVLFLLSKGALEKSVP